MKQVLIVRNGTTGRFTPIAEALKARGWRGVVLNGPIGSAVEGWPHVQWQAKAPKTPSSLRPVNAFEEALACGAAATAKAQQLKDAGFTPDLIIGHPGWGEMAFLKEVSPAFRKFRWVNTIITRAGRTRISTRNSRAGRLKRRSPPPRATGCWR